jgi:hypothetical protein
MGANRMRKLITAAGLVALLTAPAFAQKGGGTLRLSQHNNLRFEDV